MDWRRFFLPSVHSVEDQQREERAEDVLREAEEFLEEMRRDVRNFQRSADDDRLGYPIAGAMRRRRNGRV